ncbi:MAG: DUF1801 domain-containing protein [Rhodobacteraceae bacterium]|nr:DUF1801 domain-containing protein [Paracoccaceae bacterium]
MLLALRQLIFDVASENPDIGDISETLKWGQPSYTTVKKSGSPIRLGVPKPGGFAIYCHCQTTLINDFAALFDRDFKFDGNRAVLFADGETPDLEKIRLLILAALTYHC